MIDADGNETQDVNVDGLLTSETQGVGIGRCRHHQLFL